MNLVYSFYSGNAEMARHTLAHAIRLNPKSGRNVLLVVPEGLDPKEVVAMLTPWADGLTVIHCERAEGWPQGKNYAWQAAARWMFTKCQEPWLWWEPDAIPLKASWLHDIEAEYKEAKAEILGCPNTSGYFDGVAVYPANVQEMSNAAMLCRAAPFDQAAGKELSHRITASKTILSIWDINGLPASFKDKADVENLCGEASLFHRCKDGSLANVLTQSLFGKMTDQFRSMFSVGPKGSTCIVMLGRYGDIINILPVCRDMAEKDGPVALMVAAQFKDLLEGVSYVRPEIFDGSFTDLKCAVELAQKRYEKVLVAQVNSRNIGVTTQCESFTEESWRQLGYWPSYNNLPLVFDRRDRQREAALVKQVRKTERPLLLLSTVGKSSPLPCASALKTHLVEKWGNRFEIIELGGIQAHRIYDLLGLIDQAAALITIDTSTLHLARATSVPLIALISESPTSWHGSKPPREAALAKRYSAVMDSLLEIDAILERCLTAGGSIPPFQVQTKWACGQFNLPLNSQVHHFNPGLVRDGKGQLWLVARKSQKNAENRFDSQLIACRLSEDMQVLDTRTLDIPKRKMAYLQHEDPRVIWKNNRFYVTLCGWNRKPRFQPPKQIIAVFSADWKYEAHFQPAYGHNNNGTQGTEKNWCLFGHNGHFHFIYSYQPHVVVEILEGNHCMPHRSAPTVSWAYGQIRGGTPPVLVGDHYLTFFHSSLPWKGGRRRYYMGAYTFEAHTPFKVKSITKEPLLVGSENDTRIHGGPPVIFPCGALLENNEWAVTFGVNDEACGWIKIPVKDLEERLCI